MVNHRFKIWIFAVFTAFVSLTGCSEALLSDVDCSGQPPIDGPVYIRFQMRLAENGSPGASRVATRADETPGTSRENAINTIDLLVCDVESGTLLKQVSLLKSQVERLMSEQSLTMGIDIDAVENPKVYIYVAANLPAILRDKIHHGKTVENLSAHSSETEYWDVMNDFVPGSSGSQEALESGGETGIPMTGQFYTTAQSGSDKTYELSISGEYTEESPLVLTADVERIVAKIHVLATATTDDDGTDYAAACSRSSGDEDTDTYFETHYSDNGWIRLENVRYIPNGTNKSTYLFRQAYDMSGSFEHGPYYKYPQYRDLNMSLDDYGHSVGNSVEFDEDTWSRDFTFYNTLSLHKDIASENAHFATVEKYDTQRLQVTSSGSGSDNRYTKGMYCLENYFSQPSDPKIYEDYGNAIPMVTHVSIAAKIIPRQLVIHAKYMSRMNAFVEAYRSDPVKFRSEYGLGRDDFGENDIERWNVIKTKYVTYFTETEYMLRSFRIITVDSEEDAKDIINWSLKHNKAWSRNPADFEQGKFPDDTFYSYDSQYDNQEKPDKDWPRYFYVTIGAVVAASGDDAAFRTYSVQHVGGWGYYYTYIDDALISGNAPYKSSQVNRNSYYIIHVQTFGTPGGTVTRPEYIKVNTSAVGWDYAGKGEIELH